MSIFDDYFALQKQVHDYFGYVENYKTIPLDDRRDQYWLVDQHDDGTGDVCYSDVPLTRRVVAAGSKISGGSIYTQRFLPTWVYRGPEFTMIAVDMHCDGNQLLMIFDNAKECTDPDLRALYAEKWSWSAIASGAK